MRYDGQDFEHLTSPSELTITSLAWYRDALHAAAGLDGVHVLEPTGLTQIKPLMLVHLQRSMTA